MSAYQELLARIAVATQELSELKSRIEWELVKVHPQLALANHLHDDLYARINHTHDFLIGDDTLFDERYAPSSHNHDTLYSGLNHTHDYLTALPSHGHNEYASVNHTHDTLYSAVGHNHGFLIKIVTGTVNSGETWVTTAPEISNLNQILAWECVIDCNNYLVDSHLYHSPTNHQFDVHIHTINGIPHVRVLTTGSSSAILGKPFRALIWYIN